MSAVYQRVMLRAIEVARSSAPEDKRAHPRVGAVVVRNNSRCGHFGVRWLQPPADSGMISICCRWREHSLG
jgi:hypothetical protein